MRTFLYFSPNKIEKKNQVVLKFKMASIIPINPPMLIRTLAEQRWFGAVRILSDSGLNRIVVERQGRWEHALERHENNPTIFYRETYRDGLLMLREALYMEEPEA